MTEHIDDAKAFGAAIKAARLQRGLSGRQAAADCGVTHSTLIQLERGDRLPMGRTMVVLLKFYKITATIGSEPREEK